MKLINLNYKNSLVKTTPKLSPKKKTAIPIGIAVRLLEFTTFNILFPH